MLDVRIVSAFAPGRLSESFYDFLRTGDVLDKGRLGRLHDVLDAGPRSQARLVFNVLEHMVARFTADIRYLPSWLWRVPLSVKRPTMTPKLWPKEAGAFIASRSADVRVNASGVESAASLISTALMGGEFGLSSWSEEPLHPKLSDHFDEAAVRAAVDWVFFVDSLNFSFWSEESPERRYTVHYNGSNYVGYWSLCAAVNRALASGLALTDPRTYSSISAADLRHVFRSETAETIPLLEERLGILRENGRQLMEHFDGSFYHCLQACGGSAVKLVQLVVDHFPSFRDEGTFDGVAVCFYKRAQILAADIWGCLQGRGLGAFSDLWEITMFADYRVPQALAFTGAIVYSADLTAALKEGVLMKSGDRWEMEIRGCSIHACELIRDRAEAIMAQAGRSDLKVNSILVDFFLWSFAKAHETEVKDIPVHKIRCIYY